MDKLYFNYVSSIRFARNDSDLIILDDPGRDHSTTIKDWFISDDNKIETIEIKYGNTYTSTELEALIDTYIINGTDGNDSLTTTNNTYNYIIDGGIGADTMTGNIGDDTYYVDDVGDVVVENANEGIDIIHSKCISYTLPDNVENLKINTTYSYSQTGIGNDLDNIIEGSYNDDTLSGGAGDDTLKGLSDTNILSGDTGNDLLYGGRNSDTYLFKLGDGLDTIFENDGTDLINFESNVVKSDIAIFMDESDNLIIDYDVLVGDSQITVQDQNNNTMERLELSSGEYLTDVDINQIIQDMTAYADFNSIALTSVEDVKNNAELMNIISTSWNSAA